MLKFRPSGYINQQLQKLKPTQETLELDGIRVVTGKEKSANQIPKMESESSLNIFLRLILPKKISIGDRAVTTAQAQDLFDQVKNHPRKSVMNQMR